MLSLTMPAHLKARVIRAILCCALLPGLAVETRADTFTLDFNSLPSNQGWTYLGSPLAEQDAYSANGSSLLQKTVGSGETTATYTLSNVVNSSEPMTLAFTARVLRRELVIGTDTGLSFYLQIYDRASLLALGLSDKEIIINGRSFNLDASVSHDYQWQFDPGGNYRFFVDGALLLSGTRNFQSSGNFITFGDRTTFENADVEITAFSFSVASGAAPDVNVQKSVDNTNPAANEPVEFTVAVDNAGIGTAADLVVVDKLPPEMAIPNGMAAFTSVGSYDPVTGDWALGNLDEGASATLVVPAVIKANQAAECIANTATASHPRDLNASNNVGLAIVRQNNTAHCVDLNVTFGISSDSRPGFPTCDLHQRYVGRAEISNLGPDSARNVVVSIAQDPVIGPNLRFEDPDCTSTPGAQCRIAEIAAGQTITIDVTSDLYQSYTAFTQTLNVNATTTDWEYYPANNNPGSRGMGGGFSSCAKSVPDFPIIGLGDGSGGGCFIATAAFGSPLHRHLDALRDFRDNYLLTNAAGRAFVTFYYQHSPPVAEFIAGRDWLRAIVRGVLIPIIYTIKYPATAGLLLLGLIAVPVVRRRLMGKRRRSTF